MSRIGNCLLASAAGAALAIASLKAVALTLAGPDNADTKRPRHLQPPTMREASTIRRYLLAISTGLAVATFSYAMATAAPIVVTWDPSASIPQLSSTTGPFSFNNATIQDYSSLYLTPTGSNTFAVTELGFVPFVAFTNGATNTTPPALNNSSNASPFGIYGAFTSTSSLTCTGTSAANCMGTISSLNFTLKGDPGYNTGFSFSPTTGNPVATDPTSTDFTLASGVLANCGAPSPTCQNQVGLSNGVPSAAVTATFNPADPLELGFFISPPSTVTLDLLASFINSTSQVVCYDNVNGAACDGAAYGGSLPSGAPAGAAVLFQIGNSLSGLNPGGGSVNFITAAVPEPTSLTLFGPALIGMFAFGWRRKVLKQ